jgi:hypothetical protein
MHPRVAQTEGHFAGNNEQADALRRQRGAERVSGDGKIREPGNRVF